MTSWAFLVCGTGEACGWRPYPQGRSSISCSAGGTIILQSSWWITEPSSPSTHHSLYVSCLDVWKDKQTTKKKNPNKPHFGYIPFTGGDHEVICAFGLQFNDSGKLLFLEAALKLSMSSLFVACQSRNDDVPGWALSSTPDVGGHHATKSLAIVWGWILPCTVGVRGEDHGPHVCSPYLYKSVFPVR